MSSGRSARLPPTPAAAAAVSSTNTTTALNKPPRSIYHTLPEPNSNNVLPPNTYGHHSNKTNSNSNNVMVGGGGVGGLVGMGANNGGNGIAGISMMSGMMTTGSASLTSGMNMSAYTNVIGICGGGGGGSVGNNSIRTIDAATEGIPCETIDALGPELAVATSQVLENLSDAERKMIIEVLNRDDNVRQRDATRIMLVLGRPDLFTPKKSS
ncbi:uncharacterized protein [Eurosta solidaginis]|uniref:uncharacterized protein isoform X2 n=1 Tax=Eurosta solidaginis TaxID=178769 RepID=UPI00353059ED